MRTTVKTIVTATILLSLYLSAFSQQVAKTIPNSTSPDHVIGFLEFKPKDYGSQKHPLIIFLHGIGERGNGTSQINNVAANAIPKFCAAGASMRFTVGGQTSSFVVLSPQLSTQYGYWPTFYVKEMIKYAKANLQIDPNRIYVTGLSLGGGGVWRAITEVTDNDYSFDGSIAAAAPCCGTQDEIDANICSTIGANHLPIWGFHSMDDGTVGVGATQHAEILIGNCKMTPAAKFTYYQSGNHAGAWINAFDTGHITTTVSGGGRFTANPNLYEWFLSNTRSSQPAYTAPVANAGAAQIITLPISVVTLTGSGTGTNGATISSYSWAKTSGPAAGTISLPLLNTTLVTGLVQGTYVFTLTVTDNHGLSSKSSITITVNPLLNTAPVANAGSGQTIKLPTSTVNLSGTGTGTNGASISSYAWTKTSGPSAGSITSANAAATAVTGLAQGAYVFTLKVTDNHGLTGSSAVTINVNPAANQSPVSNAGSNATITLPTSSTTLNGGASKDPDGTISSYAWTKTSGPASGTIANAGAASTTVSNLVQGTYVFTLKVTDNAGATASSTVTIVVNPLVTGGQSTSPGGAIGYIKQSFSMFQACNDASSSGRTAIYCSSIANGSLVYLDAAHTKLFNGGWNWFSFTPVLGGTVTQAFAVYADGSIQQLGKCAGNGSSAPTVNEPPVSNAGSNTTIVLPTSSITLNGSASRDPDGTISSYVWTKTSGPASGTIANAGAASTTVSNLVQGTYVFTLKVTDNAGVAASSTVTITVNAAATPAGQPIGYIKQAYSMFLACNDPSSNGRTAIYCNSIANGNLVYLDAAHTKLFNGGWNWFSFTPVLGGTVTQSFAVYADGSIQQLGKCAGPAGSARIADTGAVTTAEKEVQRLKDSAAGASMVTKEGKLVIYPNPVHTNATIEMYSANSGVKVISLYNSAGVLKAKYSWQTFTGNNIFSLKDVSGLANGFYIIEIRDSNGKSNGTLKFMKM